MYVPAPFAGSADDLRWVAEAYPFAVLTCPADGGIEQAQAPLLLDGSGKLTGHLARANPMAALVSAGALVTVLFTGPHAYVSPRYMAAPGLVPTWNYASVSVSGRFKALPDPLPVLTALTRKFEGGGPGAWTAGELAPDRLRALTGAIIAFEITEMTVTAKMKLSQNRTAEDQRRLAGHLMDQQDPGAQALGKLTAAMINGS